VQKRVGVRVGVDCSDWAFNNLGHAGSPLLL
jgi:hypothetical protein